MNDHDDLDPVWDALLDDGLIEPPDGFGARVMRRVREDAVATPDAPSTLRTIVTALQAAAVLVGSVAALWQTLGFVFGLWATSLAL